MSSSGSLDAAALQKALLGSPRAPAQAKAKAKANAKAKAKAKAKVAAKAKAKPQALAKGKAKAKAKAGSVSEVRRPWKRIVRTVATRAYLQGSQDQGKKKLIVEVAATWSPHYVAIIDEIKEALEKDALTKAEARELRLTLCRRYNQ